MIVLSVAPDEPLFIGDDIAVVIKRSGNGRITIGVSAPRSVTILRAVHAAREYGLPAQQLLDIIEEQNAEVDS